jgi:hypothetical protein
MTSAVNEHGIGDIFWTLFRLERSTTSIVTLVAVFAIVLVVGLP